MPAEFYMLNTFERGGGTTNKVPRSLTVESTVDGKGFCSAHPVDEVRSNYIAFPSFFYACTTYANVQRPYHRKLLYAVDGQYRRELLTCSNAAAQPSRSAYDEV